MTRVKLSVYLDVEDADRLERISIATRIPQAVLIREGVTAMLERRWTVLDITPISTAGGPPPDEKHCGICGTLGHNRRTCPTR
jgi:hypothetical protein